MLDEFVVATGYHRKYAIQVLKQSTRNDRRDPGKRPGRRRVYTAEVQAALVQVWQVAHRICGKRLVPFLPELVAALERHDEAGVAEVIGTSRGARPDTVLIPAVSHVLLRVEGGILIAFFRTMDWATSVAATL